MLNLLGKQLGRYRLDTVLGEGGMASVFKGYDTRLERFIAIKILRRQADQDSDFTIRFEHEAKALAQLTHTHIVKIYDYGDQDGMHYLVMEYLPGGTLKDKLSKPIPYLESSRLLIPMARALDYAHQRKIIHRDVKPSNILFTENQQPMLTDFGIAKVITEGQTNSNLTGAKMGLGTPDYMAPEQGLGEKIDYRVDIYSLGIVLFEMLTGQKPFTADNSMAVMIKHVSEPLPKPSLYVFDLPETVENIILKATAKKPQDRFQSMEAFAVAMEKSVDVLIKDGDAAQLKRVATKPITTALSDEASSEDRCPHCNGLIIEKAIVCQNCGEQLAEKPLPSTERRSSAPSPPFIQVESTQKQNADWEIIISNGSRAGKSYSLKSRTSIGRGKDNTIQLVDTNASRNHAIIEYVGDNYRITDLNSTNGVSLNGKRITKATLLQAGDKIVIGDTQFTVYGQSQAQEFIQQETKRWPRSASE